MEKKQMEETELKNVDVSFDDGEVIDLTARTTLTPEQVAERKRVAIEERIARKSHVTSKDVVELMKVTPVNPLINERVVVRFIRKPTAFIADKDHVLYGGMHENSKRHLVVPMLKSGSLKNVLTNSEKEFFEEYMGLAPDALSIYRKVDNYWENRQVTLGKEDTILDLSVPDDYIKYKVLLANTEIVARSLEEYNACPKATYEFVLIREEDKNKEMVSEISMKARAYRLLDTISSDRKKMIGAIYLLDHRVISNNISDEELLLLVGTAVEKDTLRFIRAVEDPFFETKVFINNCVDSGLLRRVQDMYFITETNKPLALEGQEPTLEVSAAFLNMPRNQDVLFFLQGRYNDKRS
jgi:hypothetical protein